MGTSPGGLSSAPFIVSRPARIRARAPARGGSCPAHAWDHGPLLPIRARDCEPPRNEVHAVLMRRLVGRCPFSDLFGVRGRQCLRGPGLPVEECETIEAAMRPVEFLDSEIEEVERLIARQAVTSPDARHLLGVRGCPLLCV